MLRSVRLVVAHFYDAGDGFLKPFIQAFGRYDDNSDVNSHWAGIKRDPLSDPSKWLAAFRRLFLTSICQGLEMEAQNFRGFSSLPQGMSMRVADTLLKIRTLLNEDWAQAVRDRVEQDFPLVMALQPNPTRNEMGDDEWDLWQDARETQDQDSIDIGPIHPLEDTSSARWNVNQGSSLRILRKRGGNSSRFHFSNLFIGFLINRPSMITKVVWGMTLLGLRAERMEEGIGD